jgi:tRNA threonylcarbamoyladenosine biosynthesis protein TsaE
MSFQKTWQARLDDLPHVAQEVAARLEGQKPFVLWLKGELGAGKTTLTRDILYKLGLGGDIPVLSPTYTWLTEYQTGSGLVAHMDLYRLADGDHDSVLMLLSGRSYAGLIVEWPERAEDCDLITPTAEISIKATDADSPRTIIYRDGF